MQGLSWDKVNVGQYMNAYTSAQFSPIIVFVKVQQWVLFAAIIHVSAGFYLLESMGLLMAYDV